MDWLILPVPAFFYGGHILISQFPSTRNNGRSNLLGWLCLVCCPVLLTHMHAVSYKDFEKFILKEIVPLIYLSAFVIERDVHYYLRFSLVIPYHLQNEGFSDLYNLCDHMSSPFVT